jgi:hypothetical protein
MKSIEIVLSSILLSCFILVISSFVGKSFNPKAFTSYCYRYQQALKNLNKGALDYIQRVPFENPANWVAATGNPVDVCPPGDCICFICFDSSIPIQGVLNSLYIHIQNSPGFPIVFGGGPLNLNVGGMNVTIYVFTQPCQ